MVLKARKRSNTPSHGIESHSVSHGEATLHPSKKPPDLLYRLWTAFCLIILVSVLYISISMIIQERHENQVPEEIIEEWRRNNWDPDAVRQHHELKYKEDRRVCIEKTARGECSPIWCDDGKSASWTGEILRPSDLRGNRMMRTTDQDKGHGVADCLVSDEWKFIFVHTLRSGGTTIKETMKQALCGKGGYDDNTQQCKDNAGGRRRLRMQECSSALVESPKHFSFTFVRSPYSRWVSAYTMGAAHSKVDTTQQSEGSSNKFPLSFESFMMDPDRTMTKHSTISSSYWQPQMDSILDHRGCPVVDYIGHLERFDDNWSFLLNLLGRPSPLVEFLKQNKGIVRDQSQSFRKAAKDKGILSDENELGEDAIALIQQRSIGEISLLGYGSRFPFT